MTILVTGGAGFIGSHTCVELLNEGYEVVVVDNLCNSCQESLNRVKKLTGRELKFYKTDLLDREGLEEIFATEKIDAVIHFAGLKAVGESVQKPLEYYHNNVTGTLILCDVMRNHGVKNIVFSSSATVYGMPKTVPICEDFPLSVTNPYGRTKLMIEEIMQDFCVSDPEWNITLLRYFNPIGAHESGIIGEDPKGIPNNLVPYVTQVAVGKLEYLHVFGDDYDTPDGTGVRDYIHVVDLAIGHVKAIEHMNDKPGVKIYNLGTGNGYSVLDIVHAFEKVVGKPIPYKVEARRSGDIATCYADPTHAKEGLGWTATRDLQKMCEDAWRWQSNNPNGYDEKQEYLTRYSTYSKLNNPQVIGMKREIAQQLQLPGDFAMGMVKITATGNCEAYIENYKGILEYSHEKITLQTKGCQVDILGCDLLIVYYTCDEMKIVGCIQEIMYLDI